MPQEYVQTLQSGADVMPSPPPSAVVPPAARPAVGDVAQSGSTPAPVPRPAPTPSTSTPSSSSSSSAAPAGSTVKAKDTSTASSASTSTSSAPTPAVSSPGPGPGQWACRACTFLNVASALVCGVCDSKRDKVDDSDWTETGPAAKSQKKKRGDQPEVCVCGVGVQSGVGGPDSRAIFSSLSISLLSLPLCVYLFLSPLAPISEMWLWGWV